MNIICPQCGFSRPFPPDRAPAHSVIATCPQCSCRFRFHPQDGSSEQLSPVRNEAAPAASDLPPGAIIPGMGDDGEGGAPCRREDPREEIPPFRPRDRQEELMVDEGWLEDNKTDIANRNWEKYPLALAEHGVMLVLDMEGRVLAMANYPTYDLNALVAAGDEAMDILSDPRNLLMNYPRPRYPWLHLQDGYQYCGAGGRRAAAHRANQRYGLLHPVQQR